MSESEVTWHLWYPRQRSTMVGCKMVYLTFIENHLKVFLGHRGPFRLESDRDSAVWRWREMATCD